MSRLIWKLLLLGSAVVLPGAAITLVVPNANDGVEGTTATVAPFQSGIVTFQIQFAPSQFVSVPPAFYITALGYRLDANRSSGPFTTTTWADYEITLSNAEHALEDMSETFADNIGSDAVLVRDGPLVLNAFSMTGGPGPNPFFMIPFSTPYFYAGGYLVVTFNHTASDGVDLYTDARAVDSLANTVGQIQIFGATQGIANFFHYPVVQFEFEDLPEPSSFQLSTLGLACLAWFLRSRK